MPHALCTQRHQRGGQNTAATHLARSLDLPPASPRKEQLSLHQPHPGRSSSGSTSLTQEGAAQSLPASPRKEQLSPPPSPRKEQLSLHQPHPGRSNSASTTLTQEGAIQPPPPSTRKEQFSLHHPHPGRSSSVSLGE